MRKILQIDRSKLFLSFLLIVVTYLGLLFYGDISKVALDIGKFKLWVILLGFFLAFNNYIFRFFKWEYYLKRLSIKIPLITSFLIYISGFILTLTPGKLGEVFRSFLLKERFNIAVSRTAGIVIADRLTDLFALMIIAGIGSLFFNYGWLIILLVFLIISFVTLVIEIEGIGEFFLKLIKRIPSIGDRLYKIFKDSYSSLREVAKVSFQLIPLIFSIVAWSFECLSLYFIVNYGIRFYNISLLEAFFIYSFSTIAGALAFLPAGLGLTEASITALLILFCNLPKSYSVTSTIIVRIVTLWFAIFLSIIALFLLKKRRSF